MWQFEFVWTVQTKDHSIIKLLILHFEKLFFRSLLRSNGPRQHAKIWRGTAYDSDVLKCADNTTQGSDSPYSGVQGFPAMRSFPNADAGLIFFRNPNTGFTCNCIDKVFSKLVS